MEFDDVRIGRVLSRREVLEWLGAAGLAAVASPGVFAQSNVPACVVVPEQMEGPYFVDERLDRTDIRSDPSTGRVSEGVPLEIALRISRLAAGGCVPLTGAMIDLWQCDAAGLYSDVQDANFNTRGQKFLRGHQMTDRGGLVRFRTIYPGWYPGRAVHLHVKIRTEPSGARGAEFTSQLYFDEAITDTVHALAPYIAHKGQRRLNADDSIYRNGGRDLMLRLSKAAGGYAGTFELAMRG